MFIDESSRENKQQANTYGMISFLWQMFMKGIMNVLGIIKDVREKLMYE